MNETNFQQPKRHLSQSLILISLVHPACILAVPAAMNSRHSAIKATTIKLDTLDLPTPARQAFLLTAGAFAFAYHFVRTARVDSTESPITLGTRPRYLPYTAGNLRLLTLCARPGDTSHNIADITMCLAVVTPPKTCERHTVVSVENFLGRKREATCTADMPCTDR